ncbi:MAG TPA: hypothetical protein VGW78_01170 [Candidatus Babeliales bacterium]|jgi:hypothetical protein|nr:hypothetical protein [Candidatus Babeliales bacterium]
MHKKFLANSSLFCMLSAVTLPMQATEVEKYIEKRRAELIVKTSINEDNKLNNPFYNYSKFDLDCQKVSRRFLANLAGGDLNEFQPSINDKIRYFKLEFSEQELHSLCACISKYQKIHNSINRNALNKEQRQHLDKIVKEFEDHQKEVDAYKAAVEADKQAASNS